MNFKPATSPDKHRYILALFILILVNLSYLVYQVTTFINISGKLYGVDISSYLITAEAIVNPVYRGINFLYTFPLLPIIITPLKLLPLQYYTLYLCILYFGLILLAVVWFTFGLIIINLVNENKSGLNINNFAIIIFLLTTYRPFLEQYAWGGISQFLSDIFGLATIIIFFKTNSFNTSSDKKQIPLLLPGFLLMLSLISEVYSGLYWLFVITSLNFISSPTIIINKLKQIIRIVFVSILTSSIIFLVVGNMLRIPLLGENVTMIPNAFYIHIILSDFTAFLFDVSEFFSTKWILSILILILVCFSFALKYKLRYTNDGFRKPILTNLSISLWISLVLIFLITPSFYADRFLHFLVFPLCIELLQILIYSSKLLRKHKLVIKGIISVAILIIASISTLHIQDYLNYYSYPSEYVSVLDQIKLEPGNSIVLGVQPFVASFITKHDVYPVFQPVWFTRKTQVESAIIGKLIFSNYYIVNMSDLYISFDQTGSNIIFHKYLFPYFLDIIIFPPLIIEYTVNDNNLLLLEGSIPSYEVVMSSNSIRYHFPLFYDYSYDKIMTFYINRVELTYIFTLPIKTVYMLPINSETDFKYNVIKVSREALSLKMLINYKEPWYQVSDVINIEIQTINAELVIENYTKFIKVIPSETTPEKKQRIIIKTTLTFSDTISEKSTLISIWTANDLIKQNNIKYLVVSSQMAGDIPHYINKKVIFKDDLLVIYKVFPEHAEM